MFVSATQGEHMHVVAKGGPKTALGYRIVGWNIEDGVVQDIHIIDRDGTETTVANLDAPITAAGRRIEFVPFGVLNHCCDLNEEGRT